MQFAETDHVISFNKSHGLFGTHLRYVALITCYKFALLGLINYMLQKFNKRLSRIIARNAWMKNYNDQSHNSKDSFQISWGLIKHRPKPLLHPNIMVPLTAPEVQSSLRHCHVATVG